MASLRESSKIFYHEHFMETVCRQAGTRFLIKVKRLDFIMALVSGWNLSDDMELKLAISDII